MGAPRLQRQTGYRAPGQREHHDVSDLNLAIKCAQSAIKLLQAEPPDNTDTPADKVQRLSDAHHQVRMARATLEEVEGRLRRR